MYNTWTLPGMQVGVFQWRHLGMSEGTSTFRESRSINLSQEIKLELHKACLALSIRL